MMDEDWNDMKHTSQYEKSGVRLACLGFDDPVSVVLPTGSGFAPAVSGLENWLRQGIVLSPSCSWWFPPSPVISLFLCHQRRTRSAVIPMYLAIKWLWVNTKYSIHRVLYSPSSAYTEYCIIPRLSVSRSQPVPHLLSDLIILNLLHFHDYKLTTE